MIDLDVPRDSRSNVDFSNDFCFIQRKLYWSLRTYVLYSKCVAKIGSIEIHQKKMPSFECGRHRIACTRVSASK